MKGKGETKHVILTQERENRSKSQISESLKKIIVCPSTNFEAFY